MKNFRDIDGRFLRRFLSLFASVMLVMMVGCGDSAEQDAESALKSGGPEGGRARLGNLVKDDYTVTKVDLNGDGKDDQWTYKDDTAVKRFERDMNFDGRVDMWQYPDAQGDIVEEEMDLDLDNKVDLVVFYEGGVVTRKELSTDFSGQFTVIKYFDKKGGLLRVERDENRDGTPDVFEYYENNARVRIGWDEDGDGSPDKFDNLN